MSHPLFEIVHTTTGAISIRNKVVNEIMHNPVGPWLEANALYIEQSRLAERLLMDTDTELVVFDVGLGAAANSLATLHCVRQSGGKRKLRLVSFEKDLELLRFALEHASSFDHFKGYESAIETLLAKKHWSDDRVSWELREGHFPDLVSEEAFRADLIFFDPYSPKVNQEMWCLELFAKLRAKCSGEAVLFTYSRATPIRVALLAAGFYVGQGMATGVKDETTQAAARLEDLALPLPPTWLERWKKSHTPFPHLCRPDEEESIQRAILAHPQFDLSRRS